MKNISGQRSGYPPYIITATDVTFYAVWDINEYEVTFDANGGSGSTPSSATYEYGTQFTLPGPGTLSRDGFSFTGWNTLADTTGILYLAGAGVTMRDVDLKLYAHWRMNLPRIVTHPVSQDTRTGQSVSFSIEAEGVSLSYRWYRNGILLMYLLWLIPDCTPAALPMIPEVLQAMLHTLP